MKKILALLLMVCPVLWWSCANTDPLGSDVDPGLGVLVRTDPVFFTMSDLMLKDFTPGEGFPTWIEHYDPLVVGTTAPELDLNVDMFMWPSDNSIGKVTNVTEILPDGSTNYCLGLWYKIDGWADQYYWLTANMTFAGNTTNLNRYGNALQFRLRAVKLPGTIASTINWNLRSPDAVSILALAQGVSQEQDDIAAKQALEALKAGAIPVTWEWKTNILMLKNEDIKAQRCSGFEIGLNVDPSRFGQGALILIDDIHILRYFEKN